MERILRQHFAEETPGLRAPTDTWTRLESRLEGEQSKPRRFGALRDVLSKTWTGSGRLRLAGAMVVLAALLVGTAILLTNAPDTGVNKEGSASRFTPGKMGSGVAAAPAEGPGPTADYVSPTLAATAPTEGPAIRESKRRATRPNQATGDPTVTFDGAAPESTAEANPAPKSNSVAVITEVAKRPAVTGVVQEVASPAPETPERKITTQETVVDREVARTPAPLPAPTAVPTTTPTPALAELKAPEDATARTVEENGEVGGQTSATTESAPQISIATPYPQEAPTEPTRRRRRSGGSGGGGGGYAPPLVTATPYPQATPSEPTRHRRRGGGGGGGGSYSAPPDTTFKDYQRSRFAVASEDNVSTFSLDTDRTSYQLALNWARSRYDVDPASVRAEEWINAFDYQYPPPSNNDTFSIHTDLIQHPLDKGKHLARIAFQAPEVHDDAPLNVTLVLDASGSMNEGNRVAIARAAAESIRRSLGPRDSIAVVQFSGDVVRGATVEHSHPDNDSVQRSIESLRPRGSTNVQAGIDLGVQMADQARRSRPDAHNYIILMSDGVANVDATNPFAILESAYDRSSRNPIRIITVGVGIQNYNDYLLEQLAQHGNGWYRYLNDVDTARRTFSRENWLAISTPFADQTRAQVTWDPEVVRSWRIIGYENRVTPDETFTQDRKEFAEIPSGAATTVFYELELNESAIRQGRDAGDLELGKVQLRWVKPGTGVRHAQHSKISGHPGTTFGRSADNFLRLGAIVALASDRFSALSNPHDGLEYGVSAELFMLQHRLQTLKDPLGDLKAYKDLAFLLEHMADGAAELAPVEPRSGYSR